MVDEQAWISDLTEGTMNDRSGNPMDPTAKTAKDTNKYETVEEKTLAQQWFEEMAAGNFSKIIQEILLGNLAPDIKNPEGYTVLHIAAWKDLHEKVSYLLDEGQLPVNLLSSTGQTPLVLAAMNGCTRTMKILLDRGADIELADKVKFTPAFTAANHNQIDAMLLLMSRGANMKSRDLSGCTVIHWAAYNNNVKLLRLLIALGHDINATDDHKYTPLHRAISSHAIHAVEFLLSQSPNMDIRNQQNLTPLEYAISEDVQPVTDIMQGKERGGTMGVSNFKILCLIAFISIYSSYWLYILPYTAQYLFLSLFFNICALWSPILFVLLSLSQPTTIKVIQKSLTESHAYQQLCEYFEEENWDGMQSGELICYTCMHIRPQRSRHSRFADGCVPKFDHYSGLLGKVIGEGNYKLYCMTVFSAYFTVILFLLLQFLVCSQMLEDDNFPYPTYWFSLANLVITFDMFNILAIFISYALTYQLGMTVFMLVFWISRAETANEALNRHKYRYLFSSYQIFDGSLRYKYKNPYNRGILHNWLDFLIK